MADVEHKAVDREIVKLENKLLSEYQKAFKELEQRQRSTMESYLKKLEEMKARYESKEIDFTEFRSWLKSQAYGQKWIRDMAQRMANEIDRINGKAAAIINDRLPGVYANNLNFATYTVESKAMVNTSFTLLNKDAVQRLVRKNAKVIPLVDLKKGKDIRWNMQKFNSAITQSILQGESWADTAKRLRSVVGMNFNSSKRSARTALTAAQNAGRMDGYERAAKLGIKGKKRWMATLDDHTRDTHAMLDGEAVEYDEPFTVDEYEIMYPGDPDAAPEMVYNCRCTMTFDLFETDFSTLERDNRLGDMTYEEWKEKHEENYNERKARNGS